MKISNETKIGVMAVVAVTGLILGFNFLKGSSLFQHTKKLYAVFDNVEGMEVSNAVQINGLTIGSVSAINESDKDLTRECRSGRSREFNVVFCLLDGNFNIFAVE